MSERSDLAGNSNSPGVSEVRRLQLEIWRGMTPDEKLRIADGMILLAMEARDARIRRQNAGCSEAELVEIRNREVIASCESFRGVVDAKERYRKRGERPAEELR